MSKHVLAMHGVSPRFMEALQGCAFERAFVKEVAPEDIQAILDFGKGAKQKAQELCAQAQRLCKTEDQLTALAAVSKQICSRIKLLEVYVYALQVDPDDSELRIDAQRIVMFVQARFSTLESFNTAGTPIAA